MRIEVEVDLGCEGGVCVVVCAEVKVVVEWFWARCFGGRGEGNFRVEWLFSLFAMLNVDWESPVGSFSSFRMISFNLGNSLFS